MTRETDADEVRALARALDDGEPIEQWRTLFKRLFPPRSYLDDYTELKRDRLILAAARYSVRESVAILAQRYGYNPSTTIKIVDGSVTAINEPAQELYDAMSADERAARLTELHL